MSNALIAAIIGDVALILAVSALMATVARRIGQPSVVGQLVAGILLGPTLFGRLPWHLFAKVFPTGVLPPLTVLGQVAVVFFMFLVGYELDWGAMRGKWRAAPLVSGSAVLVPLTLGTTAALLFRSRFAALGHLQTTHSFALFMGVALAISALPIMGAIIRERGLTGTVPATIATTSAAIMDVAAWLLLAVAMIGTSQASGRSWWVTLLLTSAFVLLMMLVARPALRWWVRSREPAAATQVVVAVVLALAAAWVTAELGLHPVFGGLLAGLAMPKGAGTREVRAAFEQLSNALLPVFFAITGLSLNVAAINANGLYLLAIVTFIASAGKLVPAYLAARASHVRPRDAAVVATLVNARGLTELIALSAGLAAGLISHELFTVLVLMALITTAMTTPLLSLLGVRPGAPVLTGGADEPGDAHTGNSNRPAVAGRLLCQLREGPP